MDNKQPNMKTILTDPNKRIDDSVNVLSRLYRTILHGLGIGPRVFDVHVKRYLTDPYSGVNQNRDSRNNHRGNLMKELSAPSMSWNVFQKGLCVIGVEEYEMILNIKRRNGISKHSILIRNNISYNDPTEDTSNTRFIDSFESDYDTALVVDNDNTVAEEKIEGLVNIMNTTKKK